MDDWREDVLRGAEILPAAKLAWLLFREGFRLCAYPPHEMMMHIYDTDQVLKNLDVSTTSCSIYVPNSFRVRITKRRIRMILSYDRALAAKPAQRYGESAEWETSAPQNLEKDRKTDMR